jgi:hypothetical protein
MIDGIICSITHFIQQGIFLNPIMFHSGDFDYYGEAMARFFSCGQRIVPDPRAHVTIQVLEMYKRVFRLFGYDIIVGERTIALPKKKLLQISYL